LIDEEPMSEEEKENSDEVKFGSDDSFVVEMSKIHGKKSPYFNLDASQQVCLYDLPALHELPPLLGIS